MSFIQTPDASSSEKVAKIYADAEAGYGYLPNMTKAFGHRPDVMERWSALLATIKTHMDLRRYELVTLAAAKELKSSYCMLAHGSVLMREVFSADTVRKIAEDAGTAPIDETERAIMLFAAKVVRDAAAIEKADVDALKKHGLADAEIFDIVAAATVRCFFSKTLDALGVEPDSAYSSMAADLRKALVIGRPIAKLS
ncbi:putative peroxidase-related enzyme [Pararhizobium capsulatum DSM 1112]|uniref:Peroxidase-related enzyme n=1 Tax=Pararhizobium capsulatum DSM 1112 TaxID=1121113 RepID=A0ABU0BQN1_9HYPH|nr:peroxidase [Pararhizobium capsulatum]MDQ0320539.1 putative peroxidase-related enzyme [Pararhizobium capsulatum DSM 1112]